MISVANPELVLKPGMTATVRIITDQREHALRVPDHALRYRAWRDCRRERGRAAQRGRPGATNQVWVLRDGRPVPVTVAIGLDDDTYAEVTQGALTVADQVITSEETRGPTTGSACRSFDSDRRRT